MARPYKGPREMLPIRVPVEHAATYRELAAQRGMPLGDYIALVLAEAHSLPVPSYLQPRDKRQGVLDVA